MEGRATKRYATLAALTLALGGAVFLNWSFAGRTPQAERRKPLCRLRRKLTRTRYRLPPGSRKQTRQWNP